jgi:hypothetical protein
VKLKPDETTLDKPVATSNAIGAVDEDSNLKIIENNPISIKKLNKDDELNLSNSWKIFSDRRNGFNGELFFWSG